MGTAIFSLKIHFLLTFLVVVLEKVEVKIKFLSHLLIARIPPFLIPNLYNYAQCFRSSNKRNYQPKKVGKLAKWIQIVLEWVVHELFGSIWCLTVFACPSLERSQQGPALNSKLLTLALRDLPHCTLVPGLSHSQILDPGPEPEEAGSKPL